MIALDLFAGTGWGVACQRLGITEHGVELMPEAVATRTAAGMHTAYRDVWDGLTDPTIVPDHDLQIASPPCQTFSAAGKGAGRAALDEVLAVVRSITPESSVPFLKAYAGLGDPRTVLVTTPLLYALRHLPTYLAWEQVPSVLPVWEACADMLRTYGYDVQVAVLHAEQYGVPQTRKRAILVASRDGHPVSLPTPTHSRYYPSDPTRLDLGVQPWVSMADALGWGMDQRPSVTVTGGGTSTGGSEPFGTGARASMLREYVKGAWVMRGNYSTNNDLDRARRTIPRPARIHRHKQGHALGHTRTTQGKRFHSERLATHLCPGGSYPAVLPAGLSVPRRSRQTAPTGR